MTNTPRWGANDRQSFWSTVGERVEQVESLSGGRANSCLERSSARLRVDRWRARRRLRPAYRRVAEQLIAPRSRRSPKHAMSSTALTSRCAESCASCPGGALPDLPGARPCRRRRLEHARAESARGRRAALAKAEDERESLAHAAALDLDVRQPPQGPADLRGHEDFLADPEGVVRRILEAFGSSAALPDLQNLAVGAPLQGNQLIRADSVAVRRHGPSRDRPDAATALAQAIWRPALRRLRPAAAASRSAR